MKKQSLANAFPKEKALPYSIIGTLALLIVALMLPLMKVKQLFFWQDDYTVLQGVVELVTHGAIILGIVLFLFSIVFPVSKLVMLLVLWYRKVNRKQRQKLLGYLEMLSKWSMMDVFVVALMIVLSKAGGALDIEPRIGVYLFGVAVLCSTFLSSWMKKKNEKLLKKKK